MPEHEHENLGGAERELEAALRGLKPNGAASIDPIACAFEAGRSAAARRALAWKSTSAVLSIALATAILMPMRSAGRLDSSRDVASSGSLATVVPLPRSNNRPTYFSMRDDVLNRGVDVLPASTGSASATPAVSLRGL